jgi:hypothetical protein
MKTTVVTAANSQNFNYIFLKIAIIFITAPPLFVSSVMGHINSQYTLDLFYSRSTTCSEVKNIITLMHVQGPPSMYIALSQTIL